MPKKRKYLGVRVPDTKKPGLDNLAEVKGIAKAIEQDYKRGRISKTLALRRLALLKLVVMRDRDFADEKKRSKAISYIDRIRARIKASKKKSKG